METTVPPAKKAPGRQTCPGNTPAQSFAGSCMLPSRQEQGNAMVVTEDPKTLFRQDGRKAVTRDALHKQLQGNSAHQPRTVPKRNGLGQAFRVECKDQGPRTDQPRLKSTAALVSARPCTESQEPSAPHVAGQSLRVIFSRTQGDCWTLRFVEGTPGKPHENQTAPSDSPASQGKGERASSQVPCSVLHEDLLVSSSSEDSDGE